MHLLHFSALLETPPNRPSSLLPCLLVSGNCSPGTLYASLPPTECSCLSPSLELSLPKGFLLQLEELEPFPSRCVGTHMAAGPVVQGLASMPRVCLLKGSSPPPLFLSIHPHAPPPPPRCCNCHPHRPSHNPCLQKQLGTNIPLQKFTYTKCTVHSRTNIHRHMSNLSCTNLFINLEMACCYSQLCWR